MNTLELMANVDAKVANATMTPHDSTLAGKLEDVTAAGKPAMRRVYDLKNAVGKRTQLTTFDPVVINITETIGRAILQRENATFIMCRELYKMKVSGKLEGLGFKSVGEYGRALFDMSPNTANQYARIGERFIDDNYKPIGALPTLSVSQYLEFLTYIEKKGLTIERIEEMYVDGVLTDGMSSKVMRKALQEEYGKGKAIETTFVDDGDKANNDNEGDKANNDNEGDKANNDNEGDKANSDNEGDKANSDNGTFDKGREVSKALSAIQTIFRVSEVLKANGVQVNFNDALDAVMDGLKSLMD